MATLRELKGRIGSVASSEKITGAMKMISSAKMRKAELALRKLTPFRTQIETVISNLLAAEASFSSPLTETRDVKHIAIVVLGSDDGLCGAYNVNIAKKLTAHIGNLRAEYAQSGNLHFTILPVGAKIAKICAKFPDPDITVTNLAQEGINVTSKSSGNDVNSLTRWLEKAFLDGRFDKIDMLYMQFKSVSRQRATAEQLIPVVQETFAAEGASDSQSKPYLFEPTPQAIFSSILPMFLMSVMQEVFTQNRASEQAARIMAMQSANDNAKKLLEQLQLEYNNLRQQSITTELLDIVGGQVR